MIDMQPYYTISQLEALPAEARLGVIGNPIAHSKSPQMHQPALDAARLGLRYVRLMADTTPGAFEQLLDALGNRGFRGVNVTVPFKKRAHDAAVSLDPLARMSGAVNTLVRQDDGWHGYNTDGPGFSRAVEESFGRPLRELRVLLLGACGGAGSALACQCALESCPALTLVNRPRPELHQQVLQWPLRHWLLHQLCKDLLLVHSTATSITSCHFDSPELPALIQQADLIVNATSLGLKEGDPMPISPALLRQEHYVYDIVTHETALHRVACTQGCTATTGLGMLLWQGAIAFEHWFGFMPETDLMRNALLRA